MKRNATIRLMIVANLPVKNARAIRRRCSQVMPLTLQKFESHRFTPKIKVLSDQSLSPKNSAISSGWKQIGRMLHVIHRAMPVSISLIRTLPNNLC